MIPLFPPMLILHFWPILILILLAKKQQFFSLLCQKAKAVKFTQVSHQHTTVMSFSEAQPYLLWIMYNVCTLHNKKHFHYSLEPWLKPKLRRFNNKPRKTNWNGFPVFESDANSLCGK